MPMILLVDDEPMMLSMLEQALRLEGFPIWTATNGVEALSIFRSHRRAIGLLIAEIQLPQMGGPTLAAMLLAHEPTLPVLFLSDSVATPLTGSSQFEFLTKPFRLDALVAGVRRLVRPQTVSVIH